MIKKKFPPINTDFRFILSLISSQYLGCLSFIKSFLRLLSTYLYCSLFVGTNINSNSKTICYCKFVCKRQPDNSKLYILFVRVEGTKYVYTRDAKRVKTF